MKRQKTSPAALLRADRANKAIRMRISGASYRVIGEILEISTSTAYGYVSEYLRDRPRESAEELRAVTLDRLDTVYASQVPAMQQGSSTAAGVMIRATEVTAKIAGIMPSDQGGQSSPYIDSATGRFNLRTVNYITGEIRSGNPPFEVIHPARTPLQIVEGSVDD